MKLYNTLGRELQDFKPINPPAVKLYTCGPTVYDQLHIGNLRTFVFYDSLARTLNNLGLKVEHVMNITDVGHLTSDADEGEDKLEKGAQREGKTVWQVADNYIDLFHKDIEKLNIIAPKYARATDYIDAQLAIVAKLLEKDFAYQTKQAIYFDTAKLSDYGMLTGQKLSEKEVGARHEVHTDPDKRHPQDFAVWFFAVDRYANHEMRWPSSWGEGFPGWHLECSAIAHELLGEPLDIHAGGVDLIGTHHTNEIAQTEAAFGKKLANWWVHGEHLLVESKKMSKSDGSFITLDEVIKRGFDPLALRLLFLQSHYRSQMNFTWPALEAAQTFLSKLYAWADLEHQKTVDAKVGETYDPALEKIRAALQEDLNTPVALGWLSGLANQSEEHGIDQAKLQPLLIQLDKLFGLKLSDRPDITEEEKGLISRRETARADNDWAEADKIRSELKDQGIEVEDTANGPLWRRV